jgi:thermitase
MQDGRLRQAKLFDPTFFVTGLPITEAYWARVRVGGQERWVLIQAFERRVLTYTPDNPPGWQVEMGNIGLHYYSWRYGAPGG